MSSSPDRCATNPRPSPSCVAASSALDEQGSKHAGWIGHGEHENENIVVLPDEEMCATLHMLSDMDENSRLNAREQDVAQREQYFDEQIQAIDRCVQSLAVKRQRLQAWEQNLRRREGALRTNRGSYLRLR